MRRGGCSRAPCGRKQPQISANRTRDHLVTRTLRDRGWTVLRIWGHELKRAHTRRLLKRLRHSGL